MAQKAEVKYDPAYILPSQIANKINNLGFNASVLDNDNNGQGSIELMVGMAEVFFTLMQLFQFFMSVCLILQGRRGFKSRIRPPYPERVVKGDERGAVI